ncbi:hypothetical protein VFPFJ_06091 [Purpureocillium lilacinum]|uniref:Uncharacterized protein n=1 Tax=Purpureocillium lilacinum TaxID=33203 RepID=A0A179HHJ0_PURLI|nr:hypothetical protein VFPFJ_06091 [Purpureocillium lilacinum]OAQ89677.1 hypothetical protein VFPFJ_06091 [Purpureocillium lilacinum]
MDLDFGRRGRGSAAGLAELTDRWTSEVIAGPTEAPAGVGNKHTSTVTNGTYSRRIEIPGRLGATALRSRCASPSPRKHSGLFVKSITISEQFPKGPAPAALAVTASEAESKVTGDAVKVNGRRTWFVLYQQPLILRPSIQTSVRALRSKTPCHLCVANVMAVAPR